MSCGQNRKRDIVELSGFNQEDQQVVSLALSVSDYYSELHPILDEARLRKEKGVVRLVGIIYDEKGSVDEKFENHYSATGVYLHGKSEYADGSVQQD